MSMSFALNAPVSAPNVIAAWVWIKNSGTTVLTVHEGDPLCYAIGTGTAAEYDGRRHTFAEKPSATNKTAFAGVSAREYVIPAGENALLEIYCPGSRGVMVDVAESTTINSSLLVFDPTTGLFKVKAGIAGRGAAYARQTVTYSAGKTRNLCQADLMEGAESGGYAA